MSKIAGLLFVLAMVLSSCGGEKLYPKAKTTEGRLLGASNCAIQIGSDGKFIEPEPYLSCAGFKDEPSLIVSGGSGIYACLVGINEDGIILAFRGTPPPAQVNMATFTDWVNNIIGLEPVFAQGFEGLVHPGFWKGAEALWPKLKPELEKRMKGAGNGKPIFVTGFGKGAGIAILTAIRMVNEGIPVKQVLTFSAPLTGDKTFAEKDAPKIKLIKFVVEGDIVSLLPPDPFFIKAFAEMPEYLPIFDRAAEWNYDEFGKERLLAFGDGKSGVSLNARKHAIAEKIKTGEPGMKEIVAAHNCDCQSTYWKLLCANMPCE